MNKTAEIPPEVLKNLNESLFMLGGNTDSEKGYYMFGAKVGYELAASQSQAGWVRAWHSVKEFGYPPKNKGVLVFIPEEDFHITSGMWDLDNKWVLLDEYRVPDCEVTHWMEMPGYPEGQEYPTLPPEMVAELKKIAKKELPKFRIETPSHTEAGIESLKKEIKDYCAGVEYVPAQDIINIVDGGLNPFPVLNL